MDNFVNSVIGDLLKKGCSECPDKIAVVKEDGQERYTYRQFEDICVKIAKSLMHLGVSKGDTVGIWLRNCPEWLMFQIGAAKVGAVVVPINAHERLFVVDKIINNCKINTLIMQPGTYGLENINILNTVCPDLDNKGELSFLKNIVLLFSEPVDKLMPYAQFLSLSDNVSDEELAKRESGNKSDEISHIIHTSGSTGVPKGVMLTHYSIINNSLEQGRRMNCTSSDIFCLQSPLFHTFGSCVGVVLPLSLAATVVVMYRFVAEKTLRRIEAERCSVVSGVPTTFIGMLEEIQKNKYDLSCLRAGTIAGAACKPQVIVDIINVLGIKDLIHAYGMTETSPCISSSLHTDPPELKSTSVGYFLPHVEYKFIDPATGEESAPGESGELCVRGYLLMKGYINMPEETEKVLDKEGWMHTGDLAYLDAETGSLKLKGRIKEVIIRSGENISPVEIEIFISTNPKVHSVCVVGIPDEEQGEEIVAFVKLRPGETMDNPELLKFCKGNLATNKIPKYAIYIDEFPLIPSGKIDKKELKQIGIKYAEEQK